MSEREAARASYLHNVTVSDILKVAEQYGDEKAEWVLQTWEDMRFYSIEPSYPFRVYLSCRSLINCARNNHDPKKSNIYAR